MKIEFQGMEAVFDMLDSVVDKSKIKSALHDACALVERSAKQKAPKVDGELRRSITSKVVNGEGIVFTPLEYAPYVEFGTGLFAEGGKGRQDVPWVYIEGGSSKKASKSKSYTLEEAKQTVAYLQEQGLDAAYTYGMKPQPYLRPALHENRENIKRIIKRGIMQND